MNRFRRNKTALEIRVNRSGGRGCLVPGVNGPGARLFFACGKKSAQAEQVIHCADELVHPSVFDAKTAQVLGCFTFIKVDKFALDLSTDHNCFSREMMAGIILDKIDISYCRIRRVGADGTR